MLNSDTLKSREMISRLTPERGTESYLEKVPTRLLSKALSASGVGVTTQFREVIDLFGSDDGTPPGFRIETIFDVQQDVIHYDLVRDIGYASNGLARPTPLLFSVDSANPYEVEPCAGIVANLTCNPGIVYDLFLNNPKANVRNEFKTIEEVVGRLADILGPGSDISVELHNPFDNDFGRILDEIARYEEILTKHRLVVKVPHTGPVNASNVSQLLSGDGRLDRRYDQGNAADYLHGHRLASRLQEAGYRINFTLMFEPYQVPLALQTRPYFINAFIRHRVAATRRIQGALAAFDATEDIQFIEELRSFLLNADYLAPSDEHMDLLQVLQLARSLSRYRSRNNDDGLDTARSALRWLQTANLPDTRLIICSMEGHEMFPDVMSMLTEDEFMPMHNRVVVTTEPDYLSRWTSTPQVVSYQRRFMKAAEGVNAAIRQPVATGPSGEVV
ncbi:transaldolase family protein [Georgenia subflava]|uniref:transaldolase family protein n=1 Tax=Georgenia subflava TaxID=1622177 RepID=UPI00186ADCF9|nr:transaldolase family protein [Georgenia subflava]